MAAWTHCPLGDDQRKLSRKITKTLLTIKQRWRGWLKNIRLKISTRWRYELASRNTAWALEIEREWRIIGEDKKLWYPVHAYQHTKSARIAHQAQPLHFYFVVLGTKRKANENKKMLEKKNCTHLTKIQPYQRPRIANPTEGAIFDTCLIVIVECELLATAP